MSSSVVICTVCRQSLDSGPPVHSPDDGVSDTRICTTPCGHVMHLQCVNRWWKTILEGQARSRRQSIMDNASLTALTGPTSYTCPLCGRMAQTPHVFELFLSFVDEYNNNDADPSAERDNLKKELEELTARNAQLKELVRGLGASVAEPEPMNEE